MPVNCHSCTLIVIPAKAGIQSFQVIMDSCLRRNDLIFDFLRYHQDYKEVFWGRRLTQINRIKMKENRKKI